MGRALEFKSFAAETKADPESLQVEAYVSGFNGIDNGGDRVERGAFRKTIAERFPKNLIKVLAEHCWPVGMPVRMEEDSRGLYTVTQLEKTEAGMECMEHIRSKVYAHASIGYIPMQSDRETLTNGQEIRVLKEIKLMEYSFVQWPMDESAEILGAKSGEALLEALHRQFQSVNRILKHYKGGPPDALAPVLRQLAELIETASALGIETPAPLAAAIDEPQEESIAPEIFEEIHAGLVDLGLTAQLLGDPQ